MQDADCHPSEFSTGSPVHQQESVDNCIPDHPAGSEDASVGLLQVVCAAAGHWTVHPSAFEDESSAPRSAFVGSGRSDRREEFEDAWPAMAGLADAASVHHLSVHHSVSVAVSVDCPSMAVDSRLLFYHRQESDCRPCETASWESLESRVVKSRDLHLEHGRSFLTQQTDLRFQQPINTTTTTNTTSAESFRFSGLKYSRLVLVYKEHQNTRGLLHKFLLQTFLSTQTMLWHQKSHWIIQPHSWFSFIRPNLN